MKTVRFFPVLFILLFFVTSCNENRVFEKHRKNFTDYRWQSSNICEFSPVIEDTTLDYQIYFAFRHIYGFQFKSISINIEMTTPSGKITSKDYVIDVFGTGNEYLSECAGDYCDLETLIEDNYKFEETGTYTFKIKHLMENDPIPNVMEVGLIIDKIPVEE
ncbi:MAG: hypothetical protein JXR68_14310 [Bacteroidales bacterium]|nr:hypothetical protein [Bacteroidales bacterium]